MPDTIETVIVGGGQAGLALSYMLTQLGCEHIVLEQAAQAGEAWRHRWDSFTLVTPNWSFRLPGAEYDGADPGGFMPGGEVIQRLENYVRNFQLPVRFGTRVSAIEPQESGKGYLVTAGSTALRAEKVVIATGLYQKPKLLAVSAALPAHIRQLHSGDYRNPLNLPAGAVLVVGGGQSGCQIAEELYQSGCKVYLSTGTAARVPRRYRGRDIYEWANLTGFLDRTPDNLPSPLARFASNPLVTGKDGGHALDLHQFFRDGVMLLGHLRGYENGNLLFAPDLKESLMKSEKLGASLIQMIDGYIAQTRLPVPPEMLNNRTDGLAAPEILELDLKQSDIGTIIWATGYAFDYTWIKLPVTDSDGFPMTQRGVTQYPGLYFLGMPWLHKQKSGLLLGVGEDAAYLADQMAGPSIM